MTARGAHARRDHARRRRVGPRVRRRPTCARARSSPAARPPRSTTRACTAEAEQRARAARVLETIADGVVLLDRRRASSGSGTRPPSRSPACRATRSSAARPWTRCPATRQIGRPRSPIDGRPPRDRAGRDRRAASCGSRSRASRFDDGTVYAFRDLTEERALEQLQVRLRRHGLARAAHAARRDLRRRPDDPPDRPRAGRPRCSERLLDVIARGVRPAGADRQRRPAREPSRRGPAAAARSRRATARELARGVIEAARGACCPRDVALELDAPRRLPPVAADPRQLRQVLVNLVDNAIKYSPDGGPGRVDARERRPRAPLLGHRRGPRHPRRPSAAASSRSSTASTRT